MKQVILFALTTLLAAYVRLVARTKHTRTNAHS
jgi:hypothetical protein